MTDRDRPTAKGRGSQLHPPNRFGGPSYEADFEHLEYDDEYLESLHNQPTEYIPDRSRSIVTENDSPDVGFRYSINPYRGCSHGCAYCLSGETLILAADGTTRPLGQLRVGDEIYGTVRRGDYRRFVVTTVLAHWQTIQPAYRIRLADGTELVASPDHRFLTERGWKHVAPSAVGQRPYLTLNNSLLGIGGFACEPAKTADYQRGYLTGMIRGDGLLRAYDYTGRRRAGRDTVYQFRLALKDQAALDRTAGYFRSVGIETQTCVFQKPTESRSAMYAIRTGSRQAFQRISGLISFPETRNLDWHKGFLAGLFDSEGSYNGSLRIHNADAQLLRHAEESLDALGFHYVFDVPKKPANLVVRTLRIRGGLREYLRFFHTTDNAILRKRNISDIALKSDAQTRVMSIEPAGRMMPMYDITTGTGDFIANGIVSHNCFARPYHEYLGYNAGLDFETKVLVKEDAPQRFREFLCRDAWRPEPIGLSGVTDCYQPAERHYRLTRGCLEVAAEARQPMSIVTKNALILRDLDLLRGMAAEQLIHVYLSVTTLDAELVGCMEPRTSRPTARLRAIKELSDAGVPVGVLVAPVIPGLNDSEIPAILEAVRAAGARTAGYVLLRLPLTVAPVFREWLERAQPARLRKIESRIRDARGGKLNDADFGTRMTGTGVMAEQIRQMFHLFRKKNGFDDRLPPYDCSRFRPPRDKHGQGTLF